jgi:hypothetical protein
MKLEPIFKNLTAEAQRRRGNAEKTCFSLRRFSLRLCGKAFRFSGSSGLG